MKKLLYFISLSLIIASCDILEPDPLTAIDAAGAITDGGSANRATLGMYARMQSDFYYGMEYVCNNDLMADNATFQGFFDSQLELDSRSVPFSNLFVNSVWVRIYAVINIANELIVKVPDIDDPQFTNQDRILGEAYAGRALAYFDLLRYFGEHFDEGSRFGVPLITEPIPDLDFNQIPKLSRSTVAETYNLILSDLNQALPLLAGTTDRGRLNEWFVRSLRARVNLYRRNYTEAFNDANEVINSSPFSLVTDVMSLYGTEPSAESIFDLEFNDQDQSAFNTFLIRRDEYNVDLSLIDAFEEGDARRALFRVERNFMRCFKYPDPTNANNAKVIRLAEIYLIRSEAAAMMANSPASGLDDLNVIRTRAGLSPIESLPSMDAYVNALLQERRIELSYEGHRYFDLARLDKIGEVLGITDSFRKILPIPRNELLVDTDNLLEQNPGYETL